MVLSVSLISGSLELCQVKESRFDYEALLFRYQNCFFESKLRLQGASVSMVVENVILSTCNEQEVKNIFEKLKFEEEPLMNLALDFSPIDDDVQYKIDLSTQPISVDYSAEAAVMIWSFFILPEAQESVKTAAWDTLQNLQDTTTATLTEFLYGETKYNLHIMLRCPHIRVPSGEHCKFLLNLGVIDIKNTNNQGQYETLNVTLSGIQLDYLYIDGEDSIIPELQMNWNLNFLKTSYKTQKWSQFAGSLDGCPDVLLEGELYELKLLYQPSFINNLKEVMNGFDFSRMNMNNDVNEIMRKCVMSSWLKKKSKNVQQWHTYFAVLSGGYIYFFVSEEAKFPISYFYIKDCSIEDVYSFGIDFSIRLRNRYGDCCLSFNSEIELHFWKRNLNEQINEFESYRSVAEDNTEDTRKSHKEKIRISFEISLFELLLANSRKQNILSFQLEKFTSDVLIRSFDTTVNIGLYKVCIVDMIRTISEHNSRAEHFTILAKSVEGSGNLMNAEFKHFNLKSPSYMNKDMDLDVKLSALQVNWNPDLISSLLSLFEFSDYKPYTKTETKKLVINPEHVLILLNIQINSLTVYLNNVKRNFSIGLINIEEMSTAVWVKDGGLEYSGNFGLLEISDLTNYPKTVISQSGVTKLMSVSVELEVYSYHEGNPKKQEKTSSLVKIILNNMHFYYFSQPFLRIIDYILYKVMGISDLNSRVKNLYSFQSGYRLSHILPAASVQAIKTLMQPSHPSNSSTSQSKSFVPSFVQFEIIMHKPTIYLYPRPQFEQGFILETSKISISNSQFQDESRGPESVWIDLFTIQMSQMEIRAEDRVMLTDFDLTVKFHKPYLSPKQQVDQEVDKSYSVICKCERLLLTMTQNDFTLLLQLMDLNLTYDDQLDEYINPKVQEFSYNPNHKFMFFNFKAKVLSFLLTYDQEELVEIFFANQEVKMWKYNNGSSVMNFSAQHWLGLIPEESVNSEKPEHAEIAEAIFSISMDNIRNFEDFEDDDMRLSYILFGPICNDDPNRPTLQIDVNTLTDGSKTVIIDITQLRLNLHLAAIMQLQNFLYYGFPDYSKLEETPYDYMGKCRPPAGAISKEVKTQYLAPELELKLTIQEPIVLLPSIIHQRVLVVQSDFSYTFYRDPESMYLIDKTPNTIKTFEAAHLEVYTCKLTELSKHSFTDIVKRKILEPVEVIFKSIQVKTSPTVSSYEVKYQMGAFLFTLSHKDMLLIINIFSFQQEVLSRENELISALIKTFSQRDDFVSRMSVDERNLMLRLTRVSERKNTLDIEATDEHDYSPGVRSMTMQPEKIISENTSSTTVSLVGVTLLFIFDTSIAYAPIVDLNFSDLIYNIEEVGPEKMYKSSFMLKSNFYNPLLDVWEPFIESVGLHFELVTCLESNPQTRGLLIVEKSTILNINLSEVMLKHFLALSNSWRVKEDSSIMEVVSPISIKNFSGCKLLIEKHSYSHKDLIEIIELEDMESKNVEVESMQMKSINLSQEYLNVSFLNDIGYTSLKNIPINKVQSLSQEVMDDTEKVPIVLDIELQGTTKLFIVRSSVVIVNETSHDLKVLFNRQSLFEERICKSQESIPVPIHFVMYKLGIMPMSVKTYDWSLFSIPELNLNNNVKEVKCEKLYFWIYTDIDKSNQFKTTFYIRPPLTFINSLSKSITLQLLFDKVPKEVVLIPAGVFNEHRYSGRIDLSCVLQLENFQKSKQKRLLRLKNREKKPKSIKLVDFKGDQTKIQLHLSTKGCQVFTFYSATTIVNNTMTQLSFIYQKSHLSYTLGGQNVLDTIVHCGPTRKIALMIGKEKSGWMHVETVGTEDIVQFEGEELDERKIKYHFAYSVTLAKVVNEELIFSKVVLIVPRFILINNMNDHVTVKQYHANKSEFLLEKGNRIPFHWPDSEMPEMIRVKVAGQWNWSGPFSLSNIGTFTIQNRHKVMLNHFLLISVEVKLVERSFYIIFQQEDEKFCNYCIENHTRATFLKVYQKGFKEETRYLDPDSLISFAWSRPQSDQEIVVEFCESSYDENLPVSQIFSFNKINQTSTILLRSGQKLYAKIDCEGPTKILKLSDMNFNLRRHEDDSIKTQYYINIQHLGLSVIEYSKDHPHELLYFFASNIVFFAQETSKQWAVELQVNNLQLDNQISIPAIYPVMLSPNSVENKTVLHISLIYNVTPNPNIYCFDKCEFLLQELALKFESKVLQKTVEMCTRLVYDSNAMFGIQDIYVKFQKPGWMIEDKIEQNKLYYFASLSLSPIKIWISLIPIKEEDESDVYGKVSKALGMAITTIDLAPVKLNTLQMTDVFGSQWQVLSALKAHYGKQLIAELISLIGHAEILGNPIGLLNNLGTGVKDFFYEPAQGIIHGPLSAGKGLIRGTGSLVRNTVEGTFDTFSKLANSMATGITTLTQDREYLMIRQREQAMNRPRNIVDGVEMGVRSFVSNLGQGISGIVNEPVKGFRKNRFKGFLLGSFRGLSGLVVKPMAGVLDVASKAAEGIKNTAGVNQLFGKNERKRPPRVFYGKNLIMKNYDYEAAAAFYLLSNNKKGRYAKEKFVDYVEGFDSKGFKWIVFLFIGKLVLFNVKKKKVTWDIPILDIEKHEIRPEGLSLLTLPSKFKRTMNQTKFVFPLSDLRVNKFISDKLSDLISED